MPYKERQMTTATKRVHSGAATDWRDQLLRLKGAYSENTVRAYRADMSAFVEWCDTEGRDAIPAPPETIAAYVEAIASTKATATITRRMAGIGRVHRLLGHVNPVASDIVALAVRRIVRRKGKRQKQAAGLSAGLRDRLMAACGDDLGGLRDQAMIAVGYDTLCRRSELVQLRAEDIEALEGGDGSILIRRSKTDQSGEGRLGYLSEAPMQKVVRWVEAANLSPAARAFDAGRGGDRHGGERHRPRADHACWRLEIPGDGRPLHPADRLAEVRHGEALRATEVASHIRSVRDVGHRQMGDTDAIWSLVPHDLSIGLAILGEDPAAAQPDS
jgi:integrase